MMKRLLIALSGAREEILERCPTERLKFQSLGWAILITSGIAVMSMWFALTSVLGLNPVLSFPIAVLWGLVIMGIDRWLVTSMQGGGSRKWAMALPRLVLALLLGSLISTPLVLRIFQSEINTQVALIKQERASDFLNKQQGSAVHKQVESWTSQVANLEKVINSRGAATVSSSSDPQIRALTTQRTTELGLEQKYYKEWQCQLYGGTGCTVKGNGPLAQASHQNYLQAVAQVSSLTGQIQRREKELAQTSAASDQSRYEQAVSALPTAQAQLSNARKQENLLRNTFEAKNNATNGLLIRLEALDQLSGSNVTLNGARLLLFLLFLVIECLPVTVKLLQKPGNYEKILDQMARRELKEAQNAIRVSNRPSALSGTLYDVRDAREVVLDDIWRMPTRMEEIPDWMSSAHTEVYEKLPEESAEETQFDEMVRGLPDLGAATDPGPSRGGIELRYRDDDL
jgi:uncharacterized protein DUF4407